MIIKELLLRENANLSGGSATFKSTVAEHHSLSADYLLCVVMPVFPKVQNQWNRAGCSGDMSSWPMSPRWSGVTSVGRAARGPEIIVVQIRQRPKQNKPCRSSEEAAPWWAHGLAGRL